MSFTETKGTNSLDPSRYMKYLSLRNRKQQSYAAEEEETTEENTEHSP